MTTNEQIAQQDARFAIDGAIAYGRMGTNQPPAGHWLTEYWSIGQQLAELGKTSAWDNQTPVDAAPSTSAQQAEPLAWIVDVPGEPELGHWFAEEAAGVGYRSRALGLIDAASPATLEEGELRAEFERQHQGRNLKQHRLRGTYISAPIAALWNQHKRTAIWMQSRPMAAATAAASHAAPTGDAAVHGDDVAVDMFAKAMKEKLAQARAKGRAGWQTCSKYELSNMLREHVEKGDPRDVANFCMFLHALGHPIQVAPRQPEDSAEADRRDAARYRRMRAGSNHGPAAAVQVLDGPYFNRVVTGEALDAAIDAALRAGKEGESNG
ncbi:hypothetical protein [Cupriavidus oxalaticus]|uniref:hypothetical protein n=1 Tax=Cupriavidus oxalaticus TaxID=96344 RepID=UPI001F0DB073|nr:hypothetical protein [Cupriavidus oxalaticus]